MPVSVTRPRSHTAIIAVVMAAATVALAGCGHGAPPFATAPASTGARSQPAGKPFPLACASVDTSGSQASLVPASATSPVTLDDIGTSVGFPVASAMPDTNSAIAFHGYESCRYQFTTPAGGAQLDVGLVVGSNPLDGKSAAAEFTATKATGLPMPDRSGNCDGCGYTFTALSGVGASALRGTDATQDDTVVAVGAGVYVEVTSTDLKESRLVRLARLVLTRLS